jgi:sugar-specific transcriptional regulator TrmB
LILDETHLQTLIQLGLSPNQAKLYLSLLNLGKATGRMLANETYLARQEIYRLIHELQNIGLIEKIISTPTEFQAVPIKIGTKILTTRKTRELEQIKQRSQSLIKDLSSINKVDSSAKKDYRFLLIPPKKLANETRERMVGNSKNKIDLITTSKRFNQAVSHFLEFYISSLKKNVVARIIVIGTEDTLLRNAKKIKKLEAFPNFSLRFITEKKTNLLIVDNKEAIITLLPQADLGASPVFWTDHPELIALYSSFFDLLWSEKNRHIILPLNPPKSQ